MGLPVFDFSILLIIINLVISVRACDVHEAEDGREEGDEEDVKQFPEKVFAVPVDAAWSGKSTQLMITFCEFCEFKSQHLILGGHFSHLFVVWFVMFVWKDENKQKEAEHDPFLEKR